MAESEAIRVLLEFSDSLTPSNIFYFAVRFLGWGVIKLLSVLVNSAQGVLNNIMKHLNFFDSAVVNGIINKIKPLAVAFLAISLLYIAFQVMVNRKKFDVSKIPGNVIIAILVIFFLPTAMKSLGDITKESFNLFTTNKSTLATEIISSNITDIYLYDKDNFKSKDINPRNNIDKNNITKIDPTEEIDRGEVNNKKVFENRVVPTTSSTSDEKYKLKRINGWFKIDSEYYRWDIKFFQIIATLLVTGLVLIFTMVKVVKLMLELAFSKIFIIGGALADISSGQKTKQMIMHILSIYIAIISVGLTLELYILGTAWLQNNVSGFGSVMINFGAGLFVIDGPNLLEKIFGVDAGLSSGVRTLMGINSALDILGKFGRGMGKTMDMAKGGLGAAAVLGAGIKGFKDGAIPDLEDEMNNDGFNPLQQKALSGNDDNKKLGDENSDIDDDIFDSVDKTPPNDDSPNDNGNDGSALYNLDKDNDGDVDLNNDLDDSKDDLYNDDIQDLDDNLGKDSELSNKSLGKEGSKLDDLDKDIPGLDEKNISPQNDDYNARNSDLNGDRDLDVNNGMLENGNERLDSNNNIGNNSTDDILQGDKFTMKDSEALNSKGRGMTNYSNLAKGESKDWSYGGTSNNNFNSNLNNGFGEGVDLSARDRVYDKPNYIDPKETRNIKYILSGAMSSKINNIKNGELANNIKTSYKIGNNTAKDLRRYVGIKEQKIKDKIVADRIRRNL